jgi:hypothetical protein
VVSDPVWISGRTKSRRDAAADEAILTDSGSDPLNWIELAFSYFSVISRMSLVPMIKREL